MIQSETEKIGSMFDEPFLGTSGLAQRKEHAKTKLFENLKEIAF